MELKSPSPRKLSDFESENMHKSGSKTQDLQKLIEEVTKKEEKWTKEQVSTTLYLIFAI